MKLIVTMSIVFILFPATYADAGDSPDGGKIRVLDYIRGFPATSGKAPETVSLKQLFAPYEVSGKLKIWKSAEKLITVQQFAEMLVKDIDKFSAEDLKIIGTAIHNAENLNIATIGLECLNSSNHELQSFAFELLIKTCIHKIHYFKPTEFQKAFVKKGLVVRPFIIDIILNTKDDYCREWAYELHDKIFYTYYTTSDNKQNSKRLELQYREYQIYKKLEALFSDPEKVQKIIASKQFFGNFIRQSMGENVRQSMRLRAVIKLLDNLNEKNHFSTKQRLSKILNPDNFEYNILNRTNGEPQKLPPIPDKLKLRYLGKAVFSGRTTNTYKWFPKKRGGFCLEDIKIAIRSNNKTKIIWMEKVLRQYIYAVLKKQLLIGQGSHELEILRYFYFSIWNTPRNNVHDKNLITIRNYSGNAASLILSHEPNAEKMLTGKNLTANDTESKSEKFYIPAQNIFVWFVPDGDYILSVNLTDKDIWDRKLLKFDNKRISVKNFNATINLY